METKMQYAGKPRDDATDPVHDGDLPEEGDTSVKLLRVEELSESDMEREEDIFSKIENDDIFSQFLQDDIDTKAMATRAVHTLAISEQLAKLAEGINLLNHEIHSQVSDHYEDLLSQATSIETLEGMLEMMHTRIQSLLSAFERIRVTVTEPYTKVVTRTAQLGRLQETCDLLRRIIRILYLSKRLRSQLQGGIREITKAAQSLNELDYLAEGVDLTGIDVLETDRRFMRQARKEVETQGQKMLEQGLDTQNQTQVATALQVFHNLSCLAQVVDRVIDSCRRHLQEDIQNSLDIQLLSQKHPGSGRGGPGKASMPAPGNLAAFRATLWTNMERSMDSIYSACAQTHHLQKVLAKKRDPVTHVCFAEHLAIAKGRPVNIMHWFWRDVTEMMTKEFENASDSSTFLKQAFEGEYPKLLRLYNDLWRRLQQFSDSMVAECVELPPDDATCVDRLEKPTEAEDDFDPEEALRQSLAPFENAYLSRSLSRLFDPINLVFSAGTFNPPTREEVESIAKTISSELNVAVVDTALCVTVSRNIAKTVQLFAVKSEQLLCTDGEASQVIGPPTPGQSRNAAVVNSLYQLFQSISKIISGLSDFPRPAVEVIQHSLQELVVLMGASIQPLFESVSDALESIVLTIHNEDFSQSAGSEGNGDAQCSLYIRELQDFIVRVQNSYLGMFQCSDFILNSIHPIACRCVELFVRHASLVRPLGDGGKMRLAADFAQMELAIAPLCRKVTDLGKSYRLLRVTRPLLFQTSEHVSKSSAIGEIVPYATALHFLFGRAPAQLKPPHELAKWSASRYSQWLDDHPSENDRLSFIKGSLETYVQAVRTSGKKEYVPIYPIMLGMLQNGLEAL